MFRRLTSLVLTTVLLVCPFLCQTDACCADDEPSPSVEAPSQVAASASCCGVCEPSRDEAAIEHSVDPPHREAPCHPIEPCADPCLCNGAVLNSTDVTFSPDGCRFATPLISVAIASRICATSWSSTPASGPPPLSGRDIRHARMSLLI